MLPGDNIRTECSTEEWANLYSGDLPAGQKFGLKVEEVILNGKSEFQDILLFKSTHYGNVLVLDGCIQVSERDEFAYQEMIAHIPLFANKNPKSVLIIGGGDGGVLREVLRHTSVEVVYMVEIDQLVVEVSKKYLLSSTATSFDDPRVTLLFQDAAMFVKNLPTGLLFDTIICDSSDPIGPAASLFTTEFYQDLYNALAPGGTLSTQGECQWQYLDFIRNVLNTCRGTFPVVKYAYTTVPTYPSGQIGFIMLAKDASVDITVPSRRVPEDMVLNYYTTALHSAAFVLPAFAARRLYGSMSSADA
ncbi:Srm [Symbiodinium microadriaticum]|nr:Srm [Symbiodinium microadriaticum]